MENVGLNRKIGACEDLDEERHAAKTRHAEGSKSFLPRDVIKTGLVVGKVLRYALHDVHFTPITHAVLHQRRVGLHRAEALIDAAFAAYELVVGAALHNAAMLEHHDFVGVLHRA